MAEQKRAPIKHLISALKLSGIVTFYFAMFVLILLAIVGASCTVS